MDDEWHRPLQYRFYFELNGRPHRVAPTFSHTLEVVHLRLWCTNGDQFGQIQFSFNLCIISYQVLFLLTFFLLKKKSKGGVRKELKHRPPNQ